MSKYKIHIEIINRSVLDTVVIAQNSRAALAEAAQISEQQWKVRKEIKSRGYKIRNRSHL